MPVFIFLKQKGEFFESSRSGLEVQLGRCLFLEVDYELYMKNKNVDCDESKHGSCHCTNYEKGELYDGCKQNNLENILREEINCVVPFLETNHTDVCKNNTNIQKV